MALASSLRLLPRAALVAAAVVCAVPAAAHAQSPPPSVPPAVPPLSARAAAQQTSFAAYRLRVKVLARRMRALGVRASAARRFTGDGMFADVPIDTF